MKLDDLEKIRASLYDCKENSEKLTIYKEYLRLLRKLAYKGNADAQCDLAAHYEDMGVMGLPNPFHNISKKFYWYSKAADNNHGTACSNLGIMYEKGEGCKQDIKKAFELYKKAAELGDYAGNLNYKIMKRQIKYGKYKLE